MIRRFSAARRPNPVFSDEFRNATGGERRKAAPSQTQLAVRLGKAKSHVALVERGQRRVDTLESYLIARCLGADPIGVFFPDRRGPGYARPPDGKA